MDLVPSLVNALVVAIAGVLVWYVARGQLQELKLQIRDVKDQITGLDSRVDGLPTRAEIDARFDGVETRLGRVETEVATLRSDLTHIALAVGARPRPQTG